MVQGPNGMNWCYKRESAYKSTSQRDTLLGVTPLRTQREKETSAWKLVNLEMRLYSMFPEGRRHIAVIVMIYKYLG